MISGLVDSIWLSLSTALSVVIPYLYLIFEKLASVEILSQEEISRIWNNLYVLLSVLILFAIAIKLINAIVNPDALTDNKKGVRKSFFSAFIAIFLVALLPIGFRLLHEIQNEIVNENIIQRYIFQNNDDNPSGELVWVAISSCIDLGAMEDVIDPTSLGLEQTSTGIWMPVDPKPWSAYAFLGVLAQARPWVALATRLTGTTALVENAFEFHPFILFIFLLVLTYELVVLVLDTALRAFKLLLLELMTPIILGAYVFKSDILKNWALEYIKTFLQVFLLIFAINLMEYIIPVATSIADNNSGFLFRGIIRMLLYIGVLRLIKQIFPLINKIFGTNIQGKGGIKGRLGEMAAVGGLAQKAWGTLASAPKKIGQGALNLGKLGAQGAAKLGYDAVDKKYKASNANQTLRNNPNLRKALGVASAIKTGLKTGSGKQTMEAYKKGSAPIELTPDQRDSILKKISANENKWGYENNSYDNYTRDKYGNVNGYKDKKQHEKDFDNSMNYFSTNTLREEGSKEVENHFRKAKRYSDKASVVKGVQSNAQAYTNFLDEIIKSKDTDATTAQILTGIRNNFEKNQSNTADELRKIQNLNIDPTQKALINDTYNKHYRASWEAKNVYKLSEFELSKNGISGTIKAAETAMNEEFSRAENIAKNWSPDAKIYFDAAKNVVSGIGGTAGGAAANDSSIVVPFGSLSQSSASQPLPASSQSSVSKPVPASSQPSVSQPVPASSQPSASQPVPASSQSSASQSTPSSSSSEQSSANTIINNNYNNYNDNNSSSNSNSHNDTKQNESTKVEVSNLDDINSTIRNAASDITNSMNMVSDSVNRSETRQRSRQEELLDAMGGHGMKSEEEIRNEDK